MPDWKGMFKKGAELAQQAKAEIEKSGLLDQGRAAPPDNSSPTAPAAPADPAAEVREVLGPDHPDPFTLVMTEDVRNAFGASAVTGPRATYSDSSGGPAWTLQTSTGEVSVDVHLYTEGYGFDEVLGYPEDELQRLPDVEDRAAVAQDMAGIQRGGETLTISVTGGEPASNVAALEQLLRAISPRMPSFSQYAARMSLPGGPVIPDILTRDVLASVVGHPFDIPSFERSDNELEIQWEALDGPPQDPYGDSEGPVRVTVTSYLVDPWELQQQQAAAGNVWAKAAVDIGEAMKEQLADAIKPVPGPWDEGYLGPDEATFKKNGRSYRVKIGNAHSETSEQVAALTRRLAEAL